LLRPGLRIVEDEAEHDLGEGKGDRRRQEGGADQAENADALAVGRPRFFFPGKVAHGDSTRILISMSEPGALAATSFQSGRIAAAQASMLSALTTVMPFS